MEVAIISDNDITYLFIHHHLNALPDLSAESILYQNKNTIRIEICRKHSLSEPTEASGRP